jgi:CheY-like chemotaxis protein
MTTVLVVESERLVRDVVADRLDEAGYEVIACPGPSAPNYTCIGTRGGRCPLEAAADVVVMDADLPGEDVADAASGLDLLSHYTGVGKPLVALRVPSDVLRLFAGERVLPLEWPPNTDALIRAIEESRAPSAAAVEEG